MTLTTPFGAFRYVQVLGDGFGGGEENPLQKVEFPLVLYLNEQKPLPAIADLQVHSVGPVVTVGPVAFVFQRSPELDVLSSLE